VFTSVSQQRRRRRWSLPKDPERSERGGGDEAGREMEAAGSRARAQRQRERHPALSFSIDYYRPSILFAYFTFAKK
jgi:hypothetical protein